MYLLIYLSTPLCIIYIFIRFKNRFHNICIVKHILEQGFNFLYLCSKVEYLRKSQLSPLHYMHFLQSVLSQDKYPYGENINLATSTCQKKIRQFIFRPPLKRKLSSTYIGLKGQSNEIREAFFMSLNFPAEGFYR